MLLLWLVVLISMVIPCIGLYILKYRCIETWAVPSVSGFPNTNTPIACLTPGTYGIPVPRLKPDVKVCQQRFNELCTLVRPARGTHMSFKLHFVLDGAYTALLGWSSGRTLRCHGPGKHTRRFGHECIPSMCSRFTSFAAWWRTTLTSKTAESCTNTKKRFAKSWK